MFLKEGSLIEKVIVFYFTWLPFIFRRTSIKETGEQVLANISRMKRLIFEEKFFSTDVEHQKAVTHFFDTVPTAPCDFKS
jgi:hypothetical protein